MRNRNSIRNGNLYLAARGGRSVLPPLCGLAAVHMGLENAEWPEPKPLPRVARMEIYFRLWTWKVRRAIRSAAEEVDILSLLAGLMAMAYILWGGR